MNSKTLISTTLSALLAVAALSAHAEDGTITFTGSIEESSCVIAADSQNITVDFGQMSTINTVAADATKNFEINLTDCPATVSNAVVSWTGETTSSGTKNLALRNDGIRVDSSSWMIGPGNQKNFLPSTAIAFDGTPETAKPITEGNNTLEYTATMLSNSPLSAGELTGNATYNITYN
ncbi:UNVERIFIED_ORG: major type 1 subunit fimbrin (pilin) [Buttiauxella agrestis ATCC 33320]